MDATHLAHCAAQLHTLAAEARAGAARVAAEQGVTWHSLAAERFRAALRREALHGRRCADDLDAAGRALAAHARAVGGAAAGGAR